MLKRRRSGAEFRWQSSRVASLRNDWDKNAVLDAADVRDLSRENKRVNELIAHKNFEPELQKNMPKIKDKLLEEKKRG